MKKTIIVSAYASICSLILTTVWLLATPISVYASLCTATCPSGTVTCSGNSCSAVDGYGCSAYDSNGNKIEKKCKKGNGFDDEEEPEAP
jgi:hypothetical protein